MIKNILLVLLSFSFAVASESNQVTSKEVRISLGKALILLEEYKAREDVQDSLIKNLNKKVTQLESKLDAGSAEALSLSYEKKAIVISSKLNVRQTPNKKAEMISQIDMCKSVVLKNCDFNEDNRLWCEIKDKGFVDAGFLSFNSKNYQMGETYYVRNAPNYLKSSIDSVLEIGSIVKINGVSSDKKWACLGEGKFIGADALSKSKVIPKQLISIK